MTSELWIEESTRPYSLSVSEFTQTGALKRFTIDRDQVETCVSRLMLAIDGFPPDTLLAASGILFVSVVRRFNLRLPSVLQFVENFLASGERKPICAVLQKMLSDDYESTVSRYETVKLSRPVRVTKDSVIQM